jgi:hypothetical protein
MRDKASEECFAEYIIQTGKTYKETIDFVIYGNFKLFPLIKVFSRANHFKVPLPKVTINIFYNKIVSL